MMRLMRSLEFVLRLWLGSKFVDRIVKSSQSNAENPSEIAKSVEPSNGQQDGVEVQPIRLSTRHGVRIGLIMLGMLVVLSLFVLVRVLWAI